MDINSVRENDLSIGSLDRFAGINKVDRDRIGDVLAHFGSIRNCSKWDEFFQTAIDMFVIYHRHNVLPGRLYDKSQDHLADCSRCQLRWQKPLRDNGFPLLYEFSEEEEIEE